MEFGSLWGVITVVGPIILIVAIAWAVLHDRGSPADVAETEEATARMYDAQNAADKARDEGD